MTPAWPMNITRILAGTLSVGVTGRMGLMGNPFLGMRPALRMPVHLDTATPEASITPGHCFLLYHLGFGF